jgi:putative ABC transport system ATP-binding protein
MALFAELNGEGVTIVVVTHDHEVADRAKRTIEMRDGRIVRDAVNGVREHALQN